jgi:ribonuclease P protein component
LRPLWGCLGSILLCVELVGGPVAIVKRAYRLRRPDQFRRVQRQGRTVHHQLLRLTVLPSRRARTRCGFVAGKRIGKAVQRNRARRRVREAVRLVLEHIVPGTDLVFVVRSAEVADIPFADLQAVVVRLLQRAAVWQAEHLTGPPDDH